MLYQSSKGAVEISTMVLSYAKNARNKLQRTEPERTEEIDALSAHIEKLEAEAIEKNLNPRATLGDNNPPDDEPEKSELPADWEAIKVHLDDLLIEAGNWADGAEIINQDQADAVSRLKSDLQKGASTAEAARVDEKKPLDEKIAEIQDRYNAYIAPMKNRKPGSVSKAVQALNNLLTSWLTKQDDERRAREKEAAEKAAAAAAEAIAARSDAKASTNLEAMDQAEDKLAVAEALLRQAKGVQSEKVQAGGGGGYRASGLRSYWRAEIDDENAALRHYVKTNPDKFRQLVQELADADARHEATRRTIPGVKFIEDRKAA